jgi:hypothetical protein
MPATAVHESMVTGVCRLSRAMCKWNRTGCPTTTRLAMALSVPLMVMGRVPSTGTVQV